MGNGTEKLAFFCQMCNKIIDNNICKVHGIDFVTIKKVDAANPTAGGDAPSGHSRMLAPTKNPDKPNERGLALTDPEKHDAQLPAVPGSIEEQYTAPPVPEQPEPIDMDDIESIEHNIYYQAQQSRKPKEQFRSTRSAHVEDVQSSNKIKIASGITGIVVILAAAAFFLFRPSEVTPTNLYSEAENFYNAQNYDQAFTLYSQFLEDFPNNPLAPMVEERINKLQAMLSISGQIHDPADIQSLMLQANVAFQKGYYAAPEGENAIHYVVSALAQDAEYTPALELKGRLIDVLNLEAERALDAEDYTTAIGHYQAVLKLTPNDTDVINKIQGILGEMSQVTRN